MRVDTALCSTYWEDNKLLSIHVNTTTLNPIRYNKNLNHSLIDEYHRTRELTGEEKIGEFWKRTKR